MKLCFLHGKLYWHLACKQQLPIEALPKVAIVGRPNVGKSAMFNRLAGSSLAVVFDYPGVTRDRLYTRAFWGDKEFCLIDTGGLMSDATKLPAEQQAAAMASISAEGLPQAIERQAAAGVAEADSVVLVVDGQSGLHPSDEEVLSWLRQHHPGKPVVLAVNKCESTTQGPTQAAEFWELGLEPFPVSAISGTGTGEMLDKLVGTLPPPKDMESIDEKDKPLAIAIVGRPNVGKSSLLNAVCGEERAIVCDLSGTTRDAVDTTVTLPGGQQLTLIDTAGIRKRARVADSKDGAEQLSVDRAMRAVSRAEVVAIVLDGSEGVTQQDFRLSELWDRVAPKAAEDMDAYKADVKAQLRPVGWAPIVCTTASKGRSVDQVVAAILAVGEQHKRRVSTATLNLVLREAVAWKAPPSQRGSLKQGRIYYATQAAVSPPTFVLFVNDPRLFSDDYRRYIERNVRQNMGFEGSPIRFWYRARRTAEREREPAAAAASSSAGGRSSSGGRGGGRGGRGGRSGSRGGKQR
ncbi:P-loop containing nucleoside triphosphate hydrolase protein [Scenedesmus sp. NREL 46B-D3]|nr:P-loop containing nucleoside triphosphate hydrolase protein [Scenedesmus sp. NREL 46B-D3]